MSALDRLLNGNRPEANEDLGRLKNINANSSFKKLEIPIYWTSASTFPMCGSSEMTLWS